MTTNTEFKAKPGMTIYPDLWPPSGTEIIDSDEYEKWYFGYEMLRLKTYQEFIPSVAVKITITGRVIKYTSCDKRLRCRIEFLKDGEPSDFTGGWIVIPRYS